MSGSLAFGILEGSFLAAYTYSPYRAIGSIIADVTVEEAHNDTVTATKKPVEIGAAITDHSYVEPAELVLRCGWSDSGNYDGYTNDVYAALVAMKNARQLITVYTGKRVYQNVLVLGVATMTDEKYEYSMLVVARIGQILLVSTSTSTLPPTQNQANPQNTADPANGGQQQTTPANTKQQSLLSQLAGYGITP